MRKIIFCCILVIAILLVGCNKETVGPTPTIAVTSTEPSATIEEPAHITEETKEVNIHETVSEAQQVEAIVKEFADAYFAADSDVMKKRFSRSHNVEFTVYEGGDPDDVVINAVKGLDNISADIAEKGYCIASVEFKKSAESDYYVYLTIKLIQEDDQWKIAFYTLEM